MHQIKGQSKPFLQNFNALFYASKVLGVYPYDFKTFYSQGMLKGSKIGSCIVLLVMFTIVALFNFMLSTFADENAIAKYNRLSLIISIALTYIAPVMMVTDQITAIRNQKALPQLFERIDCVDEELRQLGISLNNERVKRRIWLMIALALMCECYIFGASIWLSVDQFDWTIVLWIFTSLPSFYNTLDKIWFLGILFGLRARFDAINEELETITKSFKKRFKRRERAEHQRGGEVVLQAALPLSIEEIGEIKLEHLARNAFGELVRDQPLYKTLASSVKYNDLLSNFSALQEHFIKLCQLHDSTCTISKYINELWCYPILLLMAYGFVIFTSQLYFVYCATRSQTIPLVFRSAKQFFISAVLLSYLGGKCVSLMFFSWKTSQASRRTGISLHKCGVAADSNKVYEIVNHLSLKLLNHAVNFSACGFFTLDMGTLYAVCGAITSYLIILIQFNMAGQQVKISKELVLTSGSTSTQFVEENHTMIPFESTAHENIFDIYTQA